MTQQIEQIIKESKIRVYCDKKYNKSIKAEKALITDPYYRFGRIINEVKPFINARSNNWLDLGCHHGQFLELISKIFKYKTHGIDDWNLKSELPDTDFQYTKANLGTTDWELKLEKGSMNYISALEVLEHIIDTESFVKQCYNLLAVNGYLIISTPNINCLRNRILVPFGIYPAYLEYRNIIHHVRLFNKKTLVSFLEENGFSIKKISGSTFLPERLLKFKLFRIISDYLAKSFPSLCGNLIVICIKN